MPVITATSAAFTSSRTRADGLVDEGLDDLADSARNANGSPQEGLRSVELIALRRLQVTVVEHARRAAGRERERGLDDVDRHAFELWTPSTARDACTDSGRHQGGLEGQNADADTNVLCSQFRGD